MRCDSDDTAENDAAATPRRAGARNYTASFRFTTPAFASSADGVAEMRPTALKGMIRFWWRFAAWPRFHRQAGNGDSAAAIRAMKAVEDRLFGAPARKGGPGQSAMRLRLTLGKGRIHDKGNILRDTVDLDKQNGSGSKIGPGARYLGQGAVVAFDSSKTGVKAGQLEREAIAEGSEFKLHITIRGGLTEDEHQSILNAIKLLGLIGGVGTRSRRGWGSLSLLELKDGNGHDLHRPPTDAQTHLQDIRHLLGNETAPVPPYTAAFKDLKTGVGITLSAVQATDDLLALMGKDRIATGAHMLEALGAAMVLFRGHGNGGRIRTRDSESRGVESEKNFPCDHDWYKEEGCWRSPIQNKMNNFHPLRAVFGLPHNYGKVDGREAGITPLHFTRRASPLLLHVACYGDPNREDAEYAGVALIVPSDFLPSGQDQLVRSRGEAEPPTVPSRVNYQILTHYLSAKYKGKPLLHTIATMDDPA